MMADNLLNIDEIILSFLKDDISLKEKQILEEWLASDPSHKDYFKQIYMVWNAAGVLQKDEQEVENVLEKVKLNLQKENLSSLTHANSRIILNMIGKWAAVILLSLCAGAFLYRWIENKPIPSLPIALSTYNEITVPMGSKSKVRLPDGTEVTLNAGSRLTYRMDYGKVIREVDFSGEGYFKVAKQKEKPFIVHTSKANIKALGTEFNVKAYPDENTVETILVEGSVVINETQSDGDNGLKKNENVVLKPGQKLRIFKSSKKQNPSTQQSNSVESNTHPTPVKPTEDHPTIVLGNSDTRVETSWKDKRWIIQGVDLESLAILLSRKFNVNIHLRDIELKKYKFSGIIENETVEQVFSIMKYTIPVSYSIDKGEVIWSINRNKEKDYNEAY